MVPPDRACMTLGSPVDRRQRPCVARGGRRGGSYARLAVPERADQPQLGCRFRDGSARPVLIWEGRWTKFALSTLLDIRRRGIGLVARFSQIEGYKCLSLTRALDVVKCQLALA